MAIIRLYRNIATPSSYAFGISTRKTLEISAFLISDPSKTILIKLASRKCTDQLKPKRIKGFLDGPDIYSGDVLKKLLAE
jgi:hypothetical protein